MKYKIPINIDYTMLRYAKHDHGTLVCDRACDGCILYPAPGMGCAYYLKHINPIVLDRLAEAGVITKGEALDLLLEGGRK